jgi:hypothetical protein
MIYKGSFLRKEFRNAYLEDGISRKKMLGFSAFLGLVTFAIYFVLQTLKRSVLIEAIPEFILSSYFSTLYIFTIVSYIFNVFYFIIYFEYLTFIEIRNNRWYALIKLGYNPVSMIVTKIFAKLFTVLIIYTLGFLLTIFLTYFLKFPFVLNYMLALYTVGAINLILFILVTLASSLFIKNQKNARFVVFGIAISTVAFQVVSKYYYIVSDRILMQNVANLFDFSQSSYLVISGVIVSICIIVCMFTGNYIAQFYNPSYNNDNTEINGDNNKKVKIVLINEDNSTGLKYIKNSNYKVRIQSQVLNVLFSSILVCVISVMMFFNLFMLAMTFVSPEKETALFDIIPYVFQSETMEPIISFNDLAFFRKIDRVSELPKNQIVLYKNRHCRSCKDKKH